MKIITTRHLRRGYQPQNVKSYKPCCKVLQMFPFYNISTHINHSWWITSVLRTLLDVKVQRYDNTICSIRQLRRHPIDLLWHSEIRRGHWFGQHSGNGLLLPEAMSTYHWLGSVPFTLGNFTVSLLEGSTTVGWIESFSESPYLWQLYFG